MEIYKETIFERRVSRRAVLRAAVLGAGTLFFGQSMDALAQAAPASTAVTPTPSGLFNGGSPLERIKATSVPVKPPEVTPTPQFRPDSAVIETWFEGCVVGARKWEGIATHYYPGEGCYGCPPGNLTAMNVEFNYEDPMIAFNELVLGTNVLVINNENGLRMRAFVGDTGGFDKPPYNYVADLGPKVKEVLQAGEKTNVTIIELSRCANYLYPGGRR